MAEEQGGGESISSITCLRPVMRKCKAHTSDVSCGRTFELWAQPGG